MEFVVHAGAHNVVAVTVGAGAVEPEDGVWPCGAADRQTVYGQSAFDDALAPPLPIGDISGPERMMNRAGFLAVAFAVLAAATWGKPGLAADLGVVAPAPVVVAPVPVVPLVAVPVLPHIWLGHFSGGRYFAPGLIDWRDEFARFPSRRECLHWLRALRADYRAQEGFKTCLPIR